VARAVNMECIAERYGAIGLIEDFVDIALGLKGGPGHGQHFAVRCIDILPAETVLED
jgi:hypothetical protein